MILPIDIFKHKVQPTMEIYTYRKGDPLRIVAGMYKRQGKGIFQSYYGTKMCSVVIVDGKKRYVRNIYLTSIAPATPAPTKSTANYASPMSATITITRKDYESLQQAMAEVMEKVKQLDIKVKRMQQE